MVIGSYEFISKFLYKKNLMPPLTFTNNSYSLHWPWSRVTLTCQGFNANLSYIKIFKSQIWHVKLDTWSRVIKVSKTAGQQCSGVHMLSTSWKSNKKLQEIDSKSFILEPSINIWNASVGIH